MPEQSNLPHRCIHCGTRWSGYRPAHCATCHETFSTVANFDRHRSGSFTNDTRHCTEPATVGLVQNMRTHWGEPGRDLLDGGQA